MIVLPDILSCEFTLIELRRRKLANRIESRSFNMFDSTTGNLSLSKRAMLLPVLHQSPDDWIHVYPSHGCDYLRMRFSIIHLAEEITLHRSLTVAKICMPLTVQ